MGLLTDALKVLFVTSKTTVSDSERIGIVNSAGLPVGCITKANLASVLGGVFTATTPVAVGASVDIGLDYGCSYVFSDSQGHSLAFISVLYNGVVISANSGTWTAENDTPSGNYIIKVTKGVTNDGTVRVTNNGTNTRAYYYKRLI